MKRMLLFVCCLAASGSYASYLSPIALPDTPVLQKEYKITREQFLEKYGCDDSARALINAYFYRRHSHKAGFISGAGLAMMAAIASFPVNNMPDNVNGSRYILFSDKGVLMIALSILASVSVPLITVGGSLWIRYSRKRLLRMLDNYADGKRIPKGISRNIIFRAYLHYGEWGAGIKRKMKLADMHSKKMMKKALKGTRPD